MLRTFYALLALAVAYTAGAATVQMTHHDAAHRTQIAVATVNSLTYKTDGSVILEYTSDDLFCSAFGP